MKIRRIFFLSMLGLSCLLAVGCGGGSSSKAASNSSSNTVTTTGSNVAAISVDGGPLGGYPDAAFTSVTVCEPGTTTCQTIDGLLVDTGSVGLRILSSALTVSLTQQKAADGNPVAECLQFLGSFTWGPVRTADIQIGGEKASALPIQVIGDTLTGFPVPSSCTSPGGSADTESALGANGILGVGMFPQDCGAGCTAAANLYFECPGSGCVAANEPEAMQVANPVSLFASDNNGVIVQLPAVSGGSAATLSGSLVFGIGTQSNNALGSATVYTVNPSTGNFNTTFNGTSFNGESFLDTGSNGYFFPDSSIANCTDNSGFYCPATPVNLSATNTGVTSGSGTVNFTVANADTIFKTNDYALGDLGGGITTGGVAPSNYFDWGLPFFFGRNVFVAIEGSTAPGGTAPYWAY